MRQVREDRKNAARVLIAALAVSITAATGFAQVENDDIQSYLTGNGLLQRNLFDLAVPEYRDFLDEHPNHEKADVARYGLAVCLYRLDQLDDALSELDQLADLRGFEFAAQVALLRGHCLMSQSQYAKAADAFETLISSYPQHENADDAVSVLAEARYRQGQYDRVGPAAALLGARWPESPHRERVEFFAGLAAMNLGQNAEAADRFSAMLRDYPQGEFADQVQLQLAQAQHRAGSLQRALRQYQTVIDSGLAHLIPEALLGRAQILHKQGNPQEAGRTLDQLVTNYPESSSVASARFQRGRVWFDLEDYGQALDIFETFAPEAPPNLADDAAYWAAKSRIKLKRYAAAAAKLDSAISDFPESELMPRMMYDHAFALERAGNGEDAANILESFSDRYSNHELAGAAIYLRAFIAHHADDYDKARRLCTQFIRDFPAHEMTPAIAFLNAENEYLDGDYAMAESAYRNFLADHPDDNEANRARYRLGMSLYRLDQFDQAEALLASTASGRDADPEFRPALLALGDGVFARGDWPAAQQWLTQYLEAGDDQPGAADARLKLGLALQRQGDHNGALTQFDLLIDRHPQSEHTLQAEFEKGQSYAALERTSDAEAAFTRVLDEDEDSRFAPHALNHLAAIAMQRQDYERADELYARVANSPAGQSMAVESIFQRAQALMASNQMQSAIDLFSQLLDEHPNHARADTARARRAIALARIGQTQNALDELTQVQATAQIAPALMNSVAYERAWCLKQLGRTQDASTAYASLLDRNPDPSVGAYALLDTAAIEMDGNDFVGATEHLNTVRALVDDPSITLPDEIDEQSLYRLGVCAYRSNKFPQAADTLDQFVARFDSSVLMPSASLIAGEANFKAGRFTNAATHFQRVVDNFEGDPAHPASLLRLGESHVALQHWATGEEIFERYLDQFRDSELWFQARFGLGYTKENQGRFDEAIASYAQVVATHKGPTAARAQFQIGECLFAKKEYQEAATELLRVDILYAYPQWKAAAIYEAGRCFEAMGQMSQARTQFQSVVDRFADTDWARLASQRLAAAASRGRPGTSSGG